MSLEALNEKIQQLHTETDKRQSLDIAIDAANEVIRILKPTAENLLTGEDALDRAIPVNQFPNQKVENWFSGHPYFTGDKVALRFYEDEIVETKFYWLNDTSTKARVSAGVMLTPNWEDSELTRNENYKLGIDFFLTHDSKSLLLVVSNMGNLRILELNNKLSHTQYEILANLKSALQLETKEQSHKILWDSLALSEVNKKFYAGVAEQFNILLNHLISSGKDKEDAKLFASRLLGRLLFVWFLRRKRIINEDLGYFEIDSEDSTKYYDSKLKKLFFETLNQPIDKRQSFDGNTPYLNGGLFEAHQNDWFNEIVDFPSGYFNGLYNHLEKYNFTTDESSPEYEQVAIDPEMLGRVFESLLATQLTETGDQARKAKGAFYTPREIVSYMCKESLREYLYSKLENETWNEGIDKLLDTTDSEWELSHSNSKRNLWGEANLNVVPAKVISALDELTILDPACGSGAFPMGMLQLILRTYERLESRFDPYNTKLQIIQNNIYGVDIEPMAVEISRLRAWLSLIVDKDKSIEPLPNLDFKFIAANTLIKPDRSFGLDESKQANARAKMQTIIRKYFEETDKEEKVSLKEQFIKEESKIAQVSMFGESKAQKQAQSYKPFDNQNVAEFFDEKLMFGMSKTNPFDIVIGNPPYIQLQKNGGYLANLYNDEDYVTYTRTGDIYSLFYERGLELTKKNSGLLCFITSNKWMRAAYGEKTRIYLAKKDPLKLIDFGGFKVFESATVDTNILLIRNKANLKTTSACSFKNDFKIGDSIEGYFKSNIINLNGLGSGPWVINDSSLENLKTKIESVGTKLKNLPLEINFGIIPGYSKAYIIDEETKNTLISNDPNSKDIIYPMLRGRDIKPFSISFSDKYIILVHNGTSERDRINAELEYPAIYNHLLDHKDKLQKRDKANQGSHWTNLRDCAYLENMLSEKIIYPDITREPRFYYDRNGDYLLNDSCFFIKINDKNILSYSYLLAVLHSKPVTVFYKSFYAGGGLGGNGYRYKKPFIRELPIPEINDSNIEVVNKITALANQAEHDSDKSDVIKQIDNEVYKLYKLSDEEIKAIEGMD